MRNANIRDCAAIVKYFAFLENELRKPDHGLDEYIGARAVVADMRALKSTVVALRGW